MKYGIVEIDKDNNEIDFKEIFKILLKYKWSIVFVTLITLLLILLKLYFQPNIYRSSALIEVKSNVQNSIIDTEGKGSAIAIGKERIDKEIEILRTFYINKTVLTKMNMSTKYYIDSGYKKVEIYKNIPIKVSDISVFDHRIVGKKIKITPTKNGFQLSLGKSLFTKFMDYFASDKNSSTSKKIVLDSHKIYHYGEMVETDYFAFKLDKKNRLDTPMYLSILGDEKNVFDRLSKNLFVSQVTKFAPLIKVEFEDNIVERADQYVNTLVDTFIHQSIKDKEEQTAKIIAFIDSELIRTKKKLDEYESKLEDYKIKNNAIRPSLQGANYLGELGKIDNIISEYKLKQKMIQNILAGIKESDNIDTISTFLVKLDDAPTMSLINRLQSVQMKEEELRAKYSYQHPALRPIRKQIYHIKQKIIKNIKNLRARTNQKIHSLLKQKQTYKAKLNSLPTKERRLVGYKRDYEVTSKIYNSLLNKKSEKQIEMASIQSNYRVIDYAKNTEAIPVKPKRLFMILMGIMLGLILGISQALARNYFDNKIKSRKELEDLTDLPIYGILPAVNKRNMNLEVINDSKSPYAEAHRSLRTNLQFIENKSSSYVVLVSSTVSGEGKSVTVANLASIFQLADYRCVIVNTDMRKPTLHKFFSVGNQKGLSTYLSGKNSIDDVINPTQLDKLDVITSGPVPPNPSELLLSKRMEDLIADLRTKYDYVFIDSSPLGLVADTMNIMNYVDLSLFILRENYSLKEYVKDLESLIVRNELKHIGLILNGSKMTSGTYGYGYGY